MFNFVLIQQLDIYIHTIPIPLKCVHVFDAKLIHFIFNSRMSHTMYMYRQTLGLSINVTIIIVIIVEFNSYVVHII